MPPATQRASLLSATSLATVTLVPSVPPVGARGLTSRAIAVASLASGLALSSGATTEAAIIYSVESRGPNETAQTGANPLPFTDNIGNSNSNSSVEYTLVGTTASRAFRLTSLTGSGTTTLSFTSPTTSGSFSVGALSSTSLPSNGSSASFVVSVTPTTRTGASISGTFSLSGTNPVGSTVSSKTYTAGSSDITNFKFETRPVSAVASQTGNVTVYALPSQTGSPSTRNQTFTVKNIGDGTNAGADKNDFKSELWGTVSVTNGSGWSGSGVSAFDTTTNNLGTSVSRTSTFTYTAATTRGNSATSTITGNYTSGGTNNTGSTEVTVLTGITVAPVQSVTTGSLDVYALPGQTVTRDFTIKNIGDGSLASATLNGSTSNTLGSGFASVTATGSFALNDGVTGPAATTLTHTITYTGGATRGTTSDATVTATFANGNSDGSNKSQTVSQTFKAQVVAPVAATSSVAGFGDVRVGTSATTSLTVQNTGDGNLAGADDGVTLLTNLRGNVTLSGPATFTGGGAVNLTDKTSQTYMFTYAPTARGGQSATLTTTFSNGSADGKNMSSSGSSAVTATAVGPVYAASVAGTNTSSGPIINGGTILFGNAVGGLTLQDLLISNLSNDNASKDLTDLTLTNVTITGSTEFSFSLSGFDSGNSVGFGTSTTNTRLSNLVNGDGQGSIAIQFVNKAGSGTAQLRIETDEGAALGGAGAVYVYNLIWTVPEPGTIAVFGAGLLGLAISRQRRRGRAFVALTDKPQEEETLPSAR